MSIDLDQPAAVVVADLVRRIGVYGPGRSGADIAMAVDEWLDSLGLDPNRPPFRLDAELRARAGRLLEPGRLPQAGERFRLTIESTAALDGVRHPGVVSSLCYAAEHVMGGYQLELPEGDELAGEHTRVRIEVLP